MSCRCLTLRPGESCEAHPFDPTAYKPAGDSGAPPPAPLSAGAIARGLVDVAAAGVTEAYSRYLARCAELGAAAGDPPPGD